LRVDVRGRPEHREPRPLGRTRDPFALTQLDPLTAIFFSSNLHRVPCIGPLGYPNVYAPVLPTFFFSTSPVYRTPFCLYGSGLRMRRMSEATWPTSCRSMPVTVTCVCLSMAMSIPVGMSNTTGCE